MTSLISAVLWVPKGAAERHPRRYDLSDPAEVSRVERLGKIKLADAQRELQEMEELERAKKSADSGDGNDSDDWEDEGGDDNEDAKVNGQMVDDAKAVSTGDTGDDVMKQYNLDDYDEEVSRSAGEKDQLIRDGLPPRGGAATVILLSRKNLVFLVAEFWRSLRAFGPAAGVLNNIKGLSYYASGSDDPYVTLTNPNEEDETLEKQELEILPSDNLLVAAKTADEVSMLEVHVYENPDSGPSSTAEIDYDGNLYVHHDTLLPAMPLCLAWGDSRPSTSSQKMHGQKGNFVAVGTMDHHIEIWDLDVVDGLFPEAILGDDTDLPPVQAVQPQAEAQQAENEASMDVDDSSTAASVDNGASDTNGKKKKKKKKKANKPNLPASAELPSTSPYSHTDSVLCLSWNRAHRNLLASSSADGTIKLWDVSSPTCQRAIRSFSIHTKSDTIQALEWNPREPTVLVSGSWKGEIKIFDTRSPETALTVILPDGADVEVIRWDPHHEAGTAFYVATGKGQVLYYDSSNLSKPVWTLDAHQGPVAALDVNVFVKGCIVTGGIDKQVKVWNVSSPPAAASAKQSKTSISMVVSRDFGLGKVFTTLWSPDDPTVLAMAGSTAKLNVWDTWTNPGYRRAFGDRIAALQLDSLQPGSGREKAKGITGVADDDDEPLSGED